jgi:hypothetical protein
MTQADTDTLIRQLIGGDAAATAGILHRARTSDDPTLLVAAALIDPTAPDLLTRATRLAENTRDRQLVAIAVAHLDGDSDRVDVLAREHLADHPDNILVAWIAAAARPATPPAQPSTAARPHHDHQEKS